MYVEGGRGRLLSRNDKDVTATYPELRELAEALGARQVILDGEIVAMDDAGRPSFGALQPRMHVTQAAQVRRLMGEIPVTYLIFDVLYLDGRPTVDLPYTERRALLESLNLTGPCWQTPPMFEGGGAAVLKASNEQGLEGVVAKWKRGPLSHRWADDVLAEDQEPRVLADRRAAPHLARRVHAVREGRPGRVDAHGGRGGPGLRPSRGLPQRPRAG